MVKTENNRVNVKARIDRHLRIVRDSDWSKYNSSAIINKPIWNYHLYFVLFFVILIFPIYPTLANFVYNNSNYDFYRWDIDESTIIEAYFWWDLESWDYDLPIFESTNSFISVNTILNDQRNLVWTNEVINYEIKPWDSFSKIAWDFWISINSILWANNFPKNKTLRPGEIIKVPPVSWLIHQVSSWDTLWAIAVKYKIWESKIREQNWLSESDILKIWDVLVIPWAIKEEIKPVIVAPKPTPTRNTTPTRTTVTPNSSPSTAVSSSQWSYKLVRRQPKWNFVWWNCTWYVAQYKNVNWWWNANQWLANARAKWHKTWMTPTPWAIVSFQWTWYNTRYGHVWIVTEVRSDHIIVSDMNYRRLNEVTVRRIPINDRSINWYIYVD